MLRISALGTIARFVRPCVPMLAVAATAAAAPAGVALVVGNANYPGLPALPACLTSAHAVAAALRRLNFSVVEQEDATGGYLDGALAQFTQQVQAADHPPTVIYACGYAGAFNNRPFLLPVSATVSRPADLLTQGVLARSVANAGAAKTGPSLAVLDLAPMPGAPADLGLASLAQGDAPSQSGLVAATDAAKGPLPTPVANALTTALGGAPPVMVAGVMQAIRSAAGVQIAAARTPASAGNLVATPAPAAAAARPGLPAATPKPAGTLPAPPPNSVAASAAPAPAASTAAAPPASAAPSAAASMPAEAQMTEQNRRQVQIALAQLGYYDGKIDGVFGPDTRAAIRRWQFELHAPMTGALTAAEASRLAGH